MYLKLCVLFLFQLVFNRVYSLKIEGDNCILPNNIQGKCVNIRKCSSAIEILRAGKIPQICCFNENTEPIVCCKSNKSKYMCEKYGKEVSDFKQSFAVAFGKNAIPHEFPHMAALGFYNQGNIEWKCGGSLISDRFVLTAAHCLRDNNGDVKYVRMGVIILDDNSTERQDFLIIRRIPHPEYKPPLAYNDIALVKLDRTPKYSYSVKPACLHTDPPPKYNILHATGWGLTQHAGSPATVLQRVGLDNFVNSQCNVAYRNFKRRLPNGILEDRQICAGGKNKGADTCQGDSGGPLQVYRSDEGIYGIVGVTAFGKACGTINVPGVYNKVSFYVPWIESVVWPCE